MKELKNKLITLIIVALIITSNQGLFFTKNIKFNLKEQTYEKDYTLYNENEDVELNSFSGTEKSTLTLAPLGTSAPETITFYKDNYFSRTEGRDHPGVTFNYTFTRENGTNNNYLTLTYNENIYIYWNDYYKQYNWRTGAIYTNDTRKADLYNKNILHTCYFDTWEELNEFLSNLKNNSQTATAYVTDSGTSSQYEETNQIIRVSGYFDFKIEGKSKNQKDMFTGSWGVGVNNTTITINADMSSINSMENLFKGSAFNTITINNCDFSRSKSMKSMFENSTNLTNVNFNTKTNNPSVKDMSYMFSGCSNLIYVNLENLDTSNVLNMAYMFNSCKQMENYNLNNFKTNLVTDMEGMFKDNLRLQTLKIASFSTAKVTKMAHMFENNAQLIWIYVTDFFVTDKVADNGLDMFKGCSHIEGQYGTEYDSNYTNINMAHIDTEGGFKGKGIDMFYFMCGHRYYGQYRVEPTCINEGKIAYGCTGCHQNEIIYETIPKIPHNFNKKVVLVEATCSQTGLCDVYCSYIYCNLYKGQEIIPKTGHTYSDYTYFSDNGNPMKVHNCLICGYISTESNVIRIYNNYQSGFTNGLSGNGGNGGGSNKNDVLTNNGFDRILGIYHGYTHNDTSFNSNYNYIPDNNTQGIFNKKNLTFYKFDTKKLAEDEIINIDNKQVYFGKDKKLKTGWININNKTMFINNNKDSYFYGSIIKGYEQFGDKIYYFDTITGEAKKGWQYIDGKHRYFDENTGELFINKETPDGKFINGFGICENYYTGINNEINIKKE